MSDVLKWCLIGCGILVTILLIICVLIIKSKQNKSEDGFNGLLEALGGSTNISDVSLNGSRISLTFEDKNSIDKEQIKQNGVETIVVSNKKITLVIGQKAVSVYEYLQRNIK